MNNLSKTIIMTASGVLAMTGLAIQADACGLGDADFTVTADVLNVRNQPGTHGSVVSKLKKGQTVRPTALKNGWAKIGEGKWVAFDYLKMIDNCTIPENGEDYQEIEITTYEVTADVLNGRKEPSTNAKIVAKLKKGEKVYATKEHKNWLFVDYGHYEVWVSKDYVKKVEANQNNTSTQNPSVSVKEETVSMRELEVTATSLNVRKGPGTNYGVARTLKKGQTAMSNVKSGKWYKINDNEWIHEDYVNVTIWSLNSNSTWDDILDAPPMEEVEENNIRTVSSPDGTLNVRYTTTLSGSVKHVLKNGDNVEVVYEMNGRARIKYTNNYGISDYGYVASRYLV